MTIEALAILCAACIGLFLCFRKIQAQKHTLELFNLVIHHMVDQLTVVKWNTELIIGKDCGKLSISQMEVMDKVQHSIDDVIEVVQKFIAMTSDTQHLAMDAKTKQSVSKLLETIRAS